MRFLLGAASLVLVVAGLRAGAPILIPIVVALFLALVTFPFVALLRKYRVPPGVSVGLTVVAALAALVGPGMVLVAAVQEFARAAPGYGVELRQTVTSWSDRWSEWLLGLGIDTPDLTADLLRQVDPASVLDLTVSGLSGVVTVFSVGFLVVLVTAFMLIQGVQLLENPPLDLPAGSAKNVARIIGEIQAYLGVKTVVSLMTGFVAWAWLSILDVDFALLWGLTTFLLNYIPNLGSIMAAVPPALLALLQYGPSSAGFVLLGYFGINSLFGWLVEPYLTGRQLRISPLVVLLSVVVWGWIWGTAGMILSVPMTMALKIGLENSDDLRWVAHLLEGRGPR
jgi:predicted PurR-regulated permease PerM